MSQVKIQGNASGTGIFTVSAPNSNTDRSLTLPDGAGTLDRLERAGNVLQVVQTVKTDTFSLTGSPSAWTDVTGLSVSITPTSASNKILVRFAVNASHTNDRYGQLALYRNSTQIFGGNASGNQPSVFSSLYGGAASNGAIYYSMLLLSGDFLDSPATTSSVTYKIQAKEVDGGTLRINATGWDGNSSEYGRGASSITVMEIAG